MQYNLFLFDLDDTLLDFRASEKLSFARALESLAVKDGLEALFQTYQVENTALWKLFEEVKVTKDFLKVERFRRTFDKHKIEIDPEVASLRYLDTLPETVVLIDHAVEVCEWLKGQGEIGIITNGIEYVQSKRIANSKIAPFIDFISVSDECGFAKPDVRFFEHTVRKAKAFEKAKTIIVGDREEADVLGAHHFGIDSVWFNPHRRPALTRAKATHEIAHLSELKTRLGSGR